MNEAFNLVFPNFPSAAKHRICSSNCNKYYLSNMNKAATNLDLFTFTKKIFGIIAKKL